MVISLLIDTKQCIGKKSGLFGYFLLCSLIPPLLKTGHPTHLPLCDTHTEICLWAQLLQFKYDAISRKFIVSLTKLKHDKTNIHTKTNIQTTVEEIHIKWVLLSKPKKPLSTHRAGGVPDEGEQ